MSFQKDSFDRKTATEMAAQLGERVRGNYDGFKAGNYNLTLTPATATAAVIPACGDVLNCTPAETAARDWAMWQMDLRRRLPVSGAYLEAPANSSRINLILAWQEGQQTDGNADPICNVAPVNIIDPTFKCFNWIINP